MFSLEALQRTVVRDRRSIFIAALTASLICYTSYCAANFLFPRGSDTPRIYRAPRRALQQIDGEEDEETVPYPSNALPGARDVDTFHGNIRVYEWGPEEGRKVLFVHGISTPCIAFTRLARRLVRERKCRVILFDLFGRGYSDSPDPRVYRQDMELWTYQILQVLCSSRLAWTGAEADRFTMIGYSMGGGISAAFTSKFPDLVESLVLICPGGLIREHHISRSSRWLYGNVLPQALIDRWVRQRLYSSSAERPAAHSAVDPADEAAAEVPNHGHPANAGDAQSLLIPGRANSSAARVVNWQLGAHPGFLPSFISSIKYAPVTGNHSLWQAVGRRCTARRDSTRPEDMRGLTGNTVLVLLGRTDSVIVAEETEQDAIEALGEDNVLVVNLEAGHDLPIVKSDECADAICNFWDSYN